MHFRKQADCPMTLIQLPLTFDYYNMSLGFSRCPKSTFAKLECSLPDHNLAQRESGWSTAGCRKWREFSCRQNVLKPLVLTSPNCRPQDHGMPNWTSGNVWPRKTDLDALREQERIYLDLKANSTLRARRIYLSPTLTGVVRF